LLTRSLTDREFLRGKRQTALLTILVSAWLSGRIAPGGSGATGK
jgi:hypothetical protein